MNFYDLLVLTPHPLWTSFLLHFRVLYVFDDLEKVGPAYKARSYARVFSLWSPRPYTIIEDRAD